MIAMVGLDHRRASVEMRGRLAFTDERLSAALRTLGGEQRIDEVVILSTCNRTEVYLAGQEPDEALRIARNFLDAVYDTSQTNHATGAVAAPPQQALATALYMLEGSTAVQHLFEVSAGLHSMVIGEPQILGQVRAALAAAEAEHVVAEELRAAFTGALKVGKRVRAETEITRADVSVAGLGVRAARERLGALIGKTALLIGAGRTCQLSGQLLQAEGIGQLLIANRSHASAVSLARQVGGRAVTLDEITSVIGGVDVIFSATAAPHHVLSAEDVAAGRVGVTTPLIVLDLAVPSDVAPAAGDLPGVTLLTLDTLRDLPDLDAHDDPAVIASLRGRERDITDAHKIIESALREHIRAQTMRLAVPGIAALRRHVDSSEEQELAAALAQLEHLSEHDRAIIERFGARLVDKMFFHLVRRIRSLAEYDEIPPDVTMRVLSQLFSDSPSEKRPQDR